MEMGLCYPPILYASISKHSRAHRVSLTFLRWHCRLLYEDPPLRPSPQPGSAHHNLKHVKGVFTAEGGLTSSTLNKNALSAFLWETMGRSPCKRCNETTAASQSADDQRPVHVCVHVCVHVYSKMTLTHGLGSYSTPFQQVFCV